VTTREAKAKRMIRRGASLRKETKKERCLCLGEMQFPTRRGSITTFFLTRGDLPLLSLSGHLGALAGDPGYFPLDDEACPPSSHWPTLTPVIWRSYMMYSKFASIWHRSHGPYRNSALPRIIQSTAMPQRISGRTS